VLMSVYAHGLTAAPGVAWYCRRTEGMHEEAPEMREVPELPTRLELLPGRRSAPAMPGEPGPEATSGDR
jgi:hypothetical protein